MQTIVQKRNSKPAKKKVVNRVKKKCKKASNTNLIQLELLLAQIIKLQELKKKLIDSQLVINEANTILST